jgi:hypothetical protein
MRHFNYSMLILMFSFIFLTAFIAKEDIDIQNDVRYFTLKVGDKPMSKEVIAKLTNAYKAQYGKNAVVKSVTLETIKGETWLVFTSGSTNNPSVAYQTYKKGPNDSPTLPDNAPKETCTGDGCSVCKFGASGGCYCDNRGGNGHCNHSISRISDDSNFISALFN